MAFQPSEYSYGGWLDDAKAAAEAKYNQAVSYVTSARDAAVSTALAPVHAAEEAVSAATKTAAKTAADVRASTEAARDAAEKAASVVPWVVGGLVAIGGLYVWHTGRKGRKNPLDGHQAARWLLLGGTVAAGAGAALTTAGAATLQPEVLALSGPLMVLGAAMMGGSAAAEKFHESRAA